MQAPPTSWYVGEKSGRVSIGTHCLFLQSFGRDRKSGEPVVIILPGLSSSNKGWAAVVRLLKPFVRTYVYDRSGYGQSDISPNMPTSTIIASELDLLLSSANVEPPYILVAHSWGGLLSREFIALRSGDIAGLILVDANQEQTINVLDWRHPTIWSVCGGLDLLEVTGATSEHKLSSEEWTQFREEEASLKHRMQSEKEIAMYAEGFPVLAEKHQLHRNPPLLGSRPLCVIMGLQHHDFEKLYAAGIKKGNGVEGERKAFRNILETWAEKHRGLQSEQVCLSNNSRFVIAEKSGHNIHLTQPELIANMVKWAISEYAVFSL